MVGAALRRHWGLAVQHEELLQEGNGRRVWRVVTATDEVVVKEAAAPPPGLDAMAQLAELGIPHVPALLRTTAGETCVVDEGRCLWAMDWVAGVEPPDTPTTHRELGRIAARINAVEGIGRPRSQQIPDVIADLRSRTAPGPEYVDLVQGLAVLEGQPEALVHGEINRANARLRADGRIVVLDWDDLGLGVRWLEPGYPLIHVFVSEDLVLDRASAAAYYSAYTAGRGFSDESAELVFAAATLQALRYLPWGDSAARWRRLLWAVDHRDVLVSLVAKSR